MRHSVSVKRISNCQWLDDRKTRQPSLHISSHTLSLQLIHASLSQSAPPQHFSSSVLPRHLKSVKSPSVPPPLSLSIQLHLFLCGPPAVTAPSHVCQSQLAHLLPHANTPQHTRACNQHTCQSVRVHERRDARGDLCF